VQAVRVARIADTAIIPTRMLTTFLSPVVRAFLKFFIVFNNLMG
jgi:hypothetical protein